MFSRINPGKLCLNECILMIEVTGGKAGVNTCRVPRVTLPNLFLFLAPVAHWLIIYVTGDLEEIWLPRGTVAVSSLEGFRTRLDGTLGSLGLVKGVSGRGWKLDGLRFFPAQTIL